MLSFIAALYNEESEVEDLIDHVAPYVSKICLADDGSTDQTLDIIGRKMFEVYEPGWIGGPPIRSMEVTKLKHTGLPETVKAAALKLVQDSVPNGSWVLMLDADERFAPGVLEAIQAWLRTTESLRYTHVYFQQLEIIDGHHVRTFQKAKLFKKDAIFFSTGIHEDDRFEGEGLYKPDWVVYHRKTSDKQRLREHEYLDTYKRLLEEGKIDVGRYDWLRGLHHYVA